MARRFDPDASNRSLLSRIRVVGAASILFVMVLYVIGDVLELPFLRADFHADPAIVAGLGGIFFGLVGIEVAARLPGIRPRPTDEPDD